jgi:subtilase family serine protease
VKNQGASRTQASVMTCYIDGYLIGSRELPPTDPGGSATGSFLWTAAEGKHEIRIIADSTNLETEIDETNNEKRINFSTLTPDLVIQDISWFMENQLEDDEVTFDITIGNQGSDAAAACQLSVTIDDAPPVVEDLAVLPANSSSVFTITSPLNAGQHTIQVVVDSHDDVVELDETNNRQTLAFSTFSPDLVVKTISYSPRSAATGDDVTISVKIENRGRDKAPPTSLALLVNGTPVDYAEVGEIDIGALVTAEFSWKAVAGPQEIAVCADYDGELQESNETNNVMSRSITIEDKAPVEEPVNLTAGPSGDKGFLGGFWWLVLLVSAAFGAAAFVSAYKAFKKEK